MAGPSSRAAAASRPVGLPIDSIGSSAAGDADSAANSGSAKKPRDFLMVGAHTYIHTVHTYTYSTYIHSNQRANIKSWYIHIRLHTCVHTYIHIYIHTYIHKCMHTYIHTVEISYIRYTNIQCIHIVLCNLTYLPAGHPSHHRRPIVHRFVCHRFDYHL